MGFSGTLMVKNSNSVCANEGHRDEGSIPRLGRFSGVENGA